MFYYYYLFTDLQSLHLSYTIKKASAASLLAPVITDFGKEISRTSSCFAKTPSVPLCYILFIDGLLPASLVPLLLFSFLCNVGSVVKSALTRCCDVVS